MRCGHVHTSEGEECSRILAGINLSRFFNIYGRIVRLKVHIINLQHLLPRKMFPSLSSKPMFQILSVKINTPGDRSPGAAQMLLL